MTDQPELLSAPTQPPVIVPLSEIEPPEADGAANATEGSMRVLGVQSAIRLSELPEGGAYRYRIVDGRRRYRAAVALKLDTIPAIVRSDDATSAALSTLALNLNRTGNLLSEARAIRDLIDRGYNAEQIAAETRIKVSRIRAIMPLTELPSDVLDAVAAGRMSGKTAREITKLHSGAKDRALAAFRAMKPEEKFTAEALKAARVASVTTDETEAMMELDFVVNGTGEGVSLFDPLDIAAARVRSLAAVEGVSVKELAQRLLDGAQ